MQIFHVLWLSETDLGWETSISPQDSAYMSLNVFKMELKPLSSQGLGSPA